MDTNQEKGNIKSGIGWSYAERMLAQFISLTVSIILARILDPEHYGVISIVMIFITILDALVTGGFGNALIQKKEVDSLDFDTVCWFGVSVSLFMYLLLFFFSPMIADFYKMESLTLVTRIMGLRIIITSFNSVQHSYVQRNMQFKKFFWSTLGGTLVSAIVGIALALAGFGVWALVAQYLVNSFIDTIVLLFTIEWKPRFHFSFKRLRILFPFGMKILGGTAINVFNDSFRSLIIGKRYSSEDLAYYNQGKKYPAFMMNNLVETIQKVYFPAFSLIQDDRDRIKAIVRESIRLSSYILLPIIFGFIAVADKFVVCFLTSKWLPCVIFLRIICVVYLTRPLNSIIKSGLLAIGKSKISLIQELFEALASIVFVLLAVFIYDSVELIAWSYVAAMIVSTIVVLIYAKKEFNYNLFEVLMDYCPSLLLSASMMVCVYFIGKLPLNNWLLLFIQILFGIAFYFALSFVFRFKEIGYIKKILKNKKNK